MLARMSWPWGRYGPSEWLWAQVLGGFRKGPVAMVPAIDQPYCQNGTVSRRYWLNWKQANAVTIFEIQLIREIVAMLADDGIHPVQSWLTQEMRLAPCGGRKRLLDSTGTANAGYLMSAIALPRDSQARPRQLIDRIAATGRYPMAPCPWKFSTTTPTGPYGFSLGHLEARYFHSHRLDPDLSYLAVVSPLYYCRYHRTEWPGTVSSRRWPLDPAAEREPIVGSAPAGRNLPTREEIPAAAEHALTIITEWGAFLGFDIGPATSHWQRESGTYSERDEYTMTAPVTLTASMDTIRQRAEPYSAVSVTKLTDSERHDRPRHRRSSLIKFHSGHGFSGSAEIDDPNNDGRYQLVLSTVFTVPGTLRKPPPIYSKH